MSDAIEIEMDGPAVEARRGPRTPAFPQPAPTFADVIARVHAATTWEAVDAVIAPLRTAWTEEQKARLRPALRAKEAAFKVQAAQPRTTATPAQIEPKPAPSVVQPKPAVVHAVDVSRLMTSLVDWASQFEPTPTEDLTHPDTLIGHLGAIGAEGATNAAVQASGSLADGTMGYVGFTTAEGYVSALERGTTSNTRAEYIRILRDRFGWNMQRITTASRNWPVIDGSSARPIDPNPTVHVPTGPSVFDRPRGQRQAIPVITEQAQTTTQVRTQVRRREIVAGAQAEGSGVFLGWRGQGDITVAGLRRAMERAGEVKDWAPAPKSAHYHASAAFAPLNQGGLVVRSERGTRNRTSLYTGLQRRYVAAWTVLKPDHSDVGEKAGVTVIRAQLGTDGLLEIEAESGYEHLKERVQADFQRRVDEEIIPAGEVTYWLQLLLTGRFGAQRVGGMYYVPHKYAARAERVCDELAKGSPEGFGGWGVDWCLPAIPVATTDQLRSGLTRGFRDEVSRLLADLERDRERARGDKRKDIGAAGACSYMQKLRTVNERAREYAAMLGDDAVAALRKAIADAQAVLEPLCDDTAQRFAALELS